jgi:hypothetical protein
LVVVVEVDVWVGWAVKGVELVGVNELKEMVGLVHPQK